MRLWLFARDAAGKIQGGVREQTYWSSCSIDVPTVAEPWGRQGIGLRLRRETVEHPFGTIKARMGATHFLMKTLPRVAAEMALHVLAYDLTRVTNIMGVQPLMAAMRA